jgi:integral membrane protein
MPLKYAAGMPAAVKIAGWVHGVLFALFCALLLYTLVIARWSVGRTALVLVAALLPFGPFLVDRRMKQFEREFEERGVAV